MKANLKIQEKLENNVELTPGEFKVAQAYHQTKTEMDSDKIVIGGILWEKDYQSFLDALKNFEVNEFILNDTSTALMGTLQLLLENGYEVAGVESVKKETFFGDEEIKGLLIKLK